MDEETSQEPGKPDEVSMATAERMAGIFRDFLTHLSNLESSSDKRFSSQIAYMDRVILLAGGTLTLTFTVTATIGSRMSAVNRPAHHVHSLIAACWLLVVTVMAGLLATQSMIKARERSNTASTLMTATTQLKLRILEIPNAMPTQEQLNQISKATNVTQLQKTSQKLSSVSSVFSLVTQISLLAAFVLLAIFIQSNIGVMLGGK
jgi:hypothetical protein